MFIQDVLDILRLLSVLVRKSLAMGRFPQILLLLLLLADFGIALKLQGYKFMDNNSSKITVPGQGAVTREYPGVEFPLQLSICLKFKIDYDRFDRIPLLSITSLQSGQKIMAITSK